MSAHEDTLQYWVCPADIGNQGLNPNCAWQESRLAVLWTIGVFALNFGPVIVGPILDYVGPKLTAILGGSSPPYCPVARPTWAGASSLSASLSLIVNMALNATIGQPSYVDGPYRLEKRRNRRFAGRLVT